jgi:hypothetical protein
VAPESPEPGGYRPPSYQLTTWLLLGVGFVFVVGLISLRTDYRPDTSRDYPSRPQVPDATPVLLPAPEPDEEYYPCNDCHQDEPTDRTRRELEEEHDDLELAHGELWCLDCHSADDRDWLHLASDTPVAFEESWRLCTQCHGKKLADWRAGVHGKRTGHWRGPKEYRTCVVCHDPHTPPFQAIEPEPIPVRPESINLTRVVRSADEASREAH